MTSPTVDNNGAPRRYFTWGGLAIVAGLALAARVVLFVARTTPGSPEFGIYDGDGSWWMELAASMNKLGDLSAWQLGARPPLFPMTVNLVHNLGGSDNLVLFVQVLFGVATSVLGYLLAGRLLTRARGLPSPLRLALVAGVIMALDPASIWNSATLMAEPLFNMLFMACLLHLTMFIQEDKWRYLMLSGLWMILSMWTRNTTVYFWVMTPLIFFLLKRGWWRPSIVLAGFGLVMYLAWSYRNLVYTGVFTYSLQTNYQLLFLRAVSAEHLTTGAPVKQLYVDYIHEIYRRVGDMKMATAPLGDTPFWDFLVAKTPQIYAEMGRLAIEKISQYWLVALLSTANGLFRMFAITQRLPSWFTPFELAYRAVLYAFLVAGAWAAWVHKERELLTLVGIPILYVTGVTMISQVSALDTRMGTPIFNLIIILSVAGFAWAWPRIKALMARRANGPAKA